MTITKSEKESNSLNTTTTCKHIECNKPSSRLSPSFCEYHYTGGELGNGSSFEQYEIIEKDFINFITVIPINESNHLNVYSHVLRDVIIRSCVQIELFFKAWGLYETAESNNNEFSKKYFKKDNDNNLRKTKFWKIETYFSFHPILTTNLHVYVRPLNKEINPFIEWTKKDPPKWWKAYNSIKHGGIDSLKNATLENALNALCGLFLLHCTNKHSRDYISQFETPSFKKGIDTVGINFHGFTTPIDSKRYLFKYPSRSKKLELITKESIKRNSTNNVFNR